VQRRTAQVEELVLGVGCFGYGRQHAGGRVRRAAPGVGIGQDHAEAALRGAPADGQADDPASDDQDVGGGSS